MAEASIDNIRLMNEMRKELDEKRFIHTLGVAYTAALMAEVHGEDPQSAMTAGLLHDCAKSLSNKKKIDICNKNRIPITEVEYRNPFLLHAKAGRFLAENKYGIKDEDILNAIASHTTGRPDMSRLEKIIYISDYIEPGRKHAANLALIRKEAFIELDSTLLMVLEGTLSYLKSAENEIDPMTQETYDFYRKA